MQIYFNELDACFSHETCNHPKVRTKDIVENINNVCSKDTDVKGSFVFTMVTLSEHVEPAKPVFTDKDGDKVYFHEYYGPANTPFSELLCAGKLRLGPKSFKSKDEAVIAKPNISNLLYFVDDDKYLDEEKRVANPNYHEGECFDDRSTWVFNDKVRMLTPSEWNEILEIYNNGFGLNWNLQPLAIEDFYFNATTCICVNGYGLVEWDEGGAYSHDFIYLLNYRVSDEVKSFFGGAKVVSTKDINLKNYLVPIKLLKGTEVKK